MILRNSVGRATRAWLIRFLGGCAGAGFVGLLDWATGSEVSLSIFYLLPIGLTVWFGGKGAGVVVSLLAALIWFTLDRWGGAVYSHSFIAYWNASVRLGFFLLSTFLLDRVRVLTTNLKTLVNERTGSLDAEVAQHKQAQEILRGSEERFRTFFEAAPFGLALHSPPGRIIQANPAYEKMVGYSDDELRKLGTKGITHADDIADGQEFYRELFEGKRDRYQHDKRYRRKDGQLIWARRTISAVRTPTGELRYIISIVEDITPLKRTADRNAALSRLAQQLSATTTSVEAANVIVATASDLFGWDACYLHLYSPERNEIVPVLTMDTIDGRKAIIPHTTFTLEPSPLMQNVMEQGSRLINREAPSSAADVSVPLVPFGDANRPSASMMYVPLRHGSKVVGILSIQSYTQGAYQSRDLETLAALADYVGGALERISATSLTRRLEEEIIEVSKREQRRIGHDLHDGLCPFLGGVALKAKVLEETLLAGNLPHVSQARAVVEFLNDAVAETRRLARGFAPIELEAYGLISALEKLSRETEKTFGLQCIFTSSLPAASFNLPIALHLYRLSQEAIHNAIHHGQASCIEVDLNGTASQLCLTIRDNGKGFVVNVPGRTGMGLRIMEYRGNAMAGNLKISSRPNEGTEIRCIVPGWKDTPHEHAAPAQIL